MKARVILAAALLASLPGLWSAPALARPESSKAKLSQALSPDGMPRRLVLALDGIPYDVFVQMQGEGHFASFHPVSRMVSTFPSLSDVAFAQIEGSVPPSGYQTRHFDPEQGKVVGNNVGALSERAHPKIASDASSHSVPHRVFGYIAPMRVARDELHEIGEEMLASKKDVFVAYLGTSDAVLHLHGREGARAFLLEVDDYLAALQERVRARVGRPLKIDIVSDHGSTMMPSEVVPVQEAFEACGFHRNMKMEGPRDVAFALPGIVGSMAVSVHPGMESEAARCLAVLPGVDLVAVNEGDAVGVVSANGEAEIRLVGEAPERYSYRTLHGDPLALLGLAPGDGDTREFDEAWLFDLTRDSGRPDVLRRLWRGFHGDVGEPASLLLSLNDGYEVGNPALRFATKLRGGHAGTHGSLTRLSSLGILVSNYRDTTDSNTNAASRLLFGEK